MSNNREISNMNKKYFLNAKKVLIEQGFQASDFKLNAIKPALSPEKLEVLNKLYAGLLNLLKDELATNKRLNSNDKIMRALLDSLPAPDKEE